MQGQIEGLGASDSESGVCQQCRLSKVRPSGGSGAPSMLARYVRAQAATQRPYFLSPSPFTPLQVRCDRVIPCTRYVVSQMMSLMAVISPLSPVYLRPFDAYTLPNSDRRRSLSSRTVQMSAHGSRVRAAIPRAGPASRGQIRYERAS